jgi:bleomycin hydrolase
MKQLLFLIGCLLIFSAAGAQPSAKDFRFTDERILEVTPVKDQASSSTCWSFSGIAQIESELLRLHPTDTVILSDMWIVRHTYMDKAVKYLRLHGTSNPGQGGNTHDVHHVIREHGLVPEEVYPGLNYGTDRHRHAELEAAVKEYMEAVAKKPDGRLSPAWQQGLNSILDAYFGPVPETFTYRGKTCTPQGFAASLGLDWDDYVSITSFTHHPFYTSFAIEIPDNWLWGDSWNVPMEYLEQTIDHSLAGGHTVVWAADVTEPGFFHRQGFAVFPVEGSGSISGPVVEHTVTQAERQEAFDDHRTTDDHSMLIVGTARNGEGNKFYKVKNSWGTATPFGGYLYVSPAYIAAKTIALTVHRDGIPPELRVKSGL